MHLHYNVGYHGPVHALVWMQYGLSGRVASQPRSNPEAFVTNSLIFHRSSVCRRSYVAEPRAFIEKYGSTLTIHIGYTNLLAYNYISNLPCRRYIQCA